MTSTPSSGSSRNGASFASTTTRPERIRRLTAAEILDALRAALLLAVVPPALHRWGLKGVQRRLGRMGRTERKGPGRGEPRDAGRQEHVSEQVRRTAWIVDALARRAPWRPNCLSRSLVLCWLLRRRALEPELRIGVRRRRTGASDPGEVEFHAWVEHEGAVVNDVPYVRSLYATFDRPVTPPDASWT